MLFNRHLIIFAFSVLFLGIIFWWQKPEVTVSAMARGEYISNPYSIVKNYWKRMDYRQLDLASGMTALEAQAEHATLANLFKTNPFLSIQKTTIETTPTENTFLVKLILGSVIDEKKETNYLVKVEPINGEWLITSIKSVL
ncbi:MAG TPA: hypothetical protein GXX46_06700 [Peptococcaceae bacterium]|nr:hypothetical protein [Peptococcaceae bacterium]